MLGASNNQEPPFGRFFFARRDASLLANPGGHKKTKPGKARWFLIGCCPPFDHRRRETEVICSEPQDVENQLNHLRVVLLLVY